MIEQLVNLNQYKKIFICGISGSGKTTLASQISKKLGHFPIYMDEHFWLKNWVQRPEDDFYNLIDNLTLNNTWVLEGATGKVIERYAPQAEIVIWLNFSNMNAIYRVLKRTIKNYGRKTRCEMADGCIERFNLDFYKWIWNYPKEKNPKIKKFFEDNNINYIEIKNQKKLDSFFSSLCDRT